MKNKARAMYGGHSQGNDGFSLNGKSRLMSGVGDRLGKSSRITPTSDVLVKSSVMNTSGMLENRFMGILHGSYPKTWVKRFDVDLVRKSKVVCPVIDGVVKPCGPYSKNLIYNREERLLQLTAKCVNPGCEKVAFPFGGGCGCKRVYSRWEDAVISGALCVGYVG